MIYHIYFHFQYGDINYDDINCQEIPMDLSSHHKSEWRI